MAEAIAHPLWDRGRHLSVRIRGVRIARRLSQPRIVGGFGIRTPRDAVGQPREAASSALSALCGTRVTSLRGTGNSERRPRQAVMVAGAGGLPALATLAAGLIGRSSARPPPAGRAGATPPPRTPPVPPPPAPHPPPPPPRGGKASPPP